MSPDRPQDRRPIDHELLLAQAGWVRGLAGTLVRDPVGADDLAQETLLAALVRPPLRTDERSLRAWLARVVTNLSRLAVRRNTRRERREELAARPEKVAAAAEAVERAAMLQRVLDAVLELDEPYRSTVLLRFFEGLDSRGIGERLGVSPEAVRKRLSRGLERLRGKLDQEHGGDRSAWSAVLLPWAGWAPRAPALGAAAATAAVSGGLQVVWALAGALALGSLSALVAASLGSRGDVGAGSAARAAEPAAPLEASLGRRAAGVAGGRSAGLQPEGGARGGLAWSLEILTEELPPARRPAPLEPAPGSGQAKGRRGSAAAGNEGVAAASAHAPGGIARAGAGMRQRGEPEEGTRSLRDRRSRRRAPGGEPLSIGPGRPPPMDLAEVDGWKPAPAPLGQGGSLFGGGLGDAGSDPGGSPGDAGGGAVWGGTFGGRQHTAPQRRRIE